MKLKNIRKLDNGTAKLRIKIRTEEGAELHAFDWTGIELLGLIKAEQEAKKLGLKVADVWAKRIG